MVADDEDAVLFDDDGNVIFQDDFPVDAEQYEYLPQDPDEYSSGVARDDDPRRRKLRTLFPVDWLSLRADSRPPVQGPPLGLLRRKWQVAFQQAQGGQWDYVEYAPAWCDPDWDERYAWTHARSDEGLDFIAAQYYKPGNFQRQRPALRASDAAAAAAGTLSDAAKRWGLYPFHDPLLPLAGKSGVTPTRLAFPHEIALQVPRPTTRGEGVVATVNVEDLRLQRATYERACRMSGTPASDDGFRDQLEASRNCGDPVIADEAGALLQLWSILLKEQEVEEYQRYLFGGNTSSELVDREVWTMGKDATTNLAEPLHDLLTRDKWARTEDERGKEEDKPRFVYNIGGWQGEYTAHNPVVWNALQPALQLVSKVLNSDHPITFAWADVRKLRPVRGARDTLADGDGDPDPEDEELGIFRKYKFALWPEAPVDEAPDGVAATWPEFVALCRAGFDATPYVCEILRRGIEWNIASAFRNALDKGDDSKGYGATRIAHTRWRLDRPFKISINIAADFLWPLLVDEYSPAEKAAVSFGIATTMLHELAHAVCMARLMVCWGAPEPGMDPLWLWFNPTWPEKIRMMGDAHGIDILQCLKVFGRRARWGSMNYLNFDETFLRDDPTNEEGWATENEYWGGIIEGLHSATASTSSTIDDPRFLSDLLTMVCLQGWSTDPGADGRHRMPSALPAESYLRLFRKEFWNTAVRKHGVDALKLVSGEVLPAMQRWETLSWPTVAARFGADATKWMRQVWQRLADEGENHFLWRFLYYKMLVQVEPESCHARWALERRAWDAGDVAVWEGHRRARRRFRAILAAVDDAGVAAAPDRARPPPPVDGFRALFRDLRHMLRDLSREARYMQNLAAAYLRLEESPGKAAIYATYGRQFEARIEELYLGMVADYKHWLAAIHRQPDDVLAWLTLDNEAIRQLWYEDRFEMQAKLGKIEQCFDVLLRVWRPSDEVDNIYDADDAPAVRVEDLSALPSAAARNAAQRIERMAMAEYHALAPDDPLRGVADDWAAILDYGDLLRNPAAGTDAHHFNRRLSATSDAIDQAIERQQQAVELEYPDAGGQRLMQDQGLQNDQPSEEQLNQDRSFDGDQLQVFTLASGFSPYRDPKTNFTRFTDVTDQIQAPPPAPVALLPPPGNDPTAFLAALENRIEQRRMELMHLQATATTTTANPPVPAVRPAERLHFGTAAAQQSLALQDLERMVRQRDQTRGFLQQASAAASNPAVPPPSAQAAQDLARAMHDFAKTAPGAASHPPPDGWASM